MEQNNKLMLSELCYYLFFGILFFVKGIGLYDGQAVFKICLIVAVIFAALKIMLTAMDVREAVAVFCLIALGGLIYVRSGEKSALVFFLMMAGFKNIPFDRLMKVGLAVWSSAFGVMLVKYLLRIGNDTVMVHHKFGIDLLRRGLGYSHPNVLHISYGVLVVLILYCTKAYREKWKIYFGLLAGNVVIFLYSVSYTGFMLVVMFLLFHLYFFYRQNMTILEKAAVYTVYPFCVLFSLCAPLLVDPDSRLAHFMNRLLNQRFYASRLYLTENQLTLFGNRITASHTYALDNSYVTLLLYGGVIPFTLVCTAYIYAVWKGIRNRDGENLSMLLSFSIAGVIEPFLFNFSFKNLSLLVIAFYLYSECQNGKKLMLLSCRDRQITIKFPWKQGADRVEKTESRFHGRARLLTATAAGVLSGILFYSLAKMPDMVYVGEKYCDVEGALCYVDADSYEGDSGVAFYGWDNENGGLCFQGETLEYERFRDSILMAAVIFLTVEGGTVLIETGVAGRKVRK